MKPQLIEKEDQIKNKQQKKQKYFDERPDYLHK